MKPTFENLPVFLDELDRKVDALASTVERLQTGINEISRAIAEKGIYPMDYPIDIKAVSAITKLSVTTLYFYTRHGLIPCYKRGGKYYFYEHEIIEWFKSFKCENALESISDAENSSIVALKRAQK